MVVCYFDKLAIFLLKMQPNRDDKIVCILIHSGHRFINYNLPMKGSPIPAARSLEGIGSETTAMRRRIVKNSMVSRAMPRAYLSRELKQRVCPGNARMGGSWLNLYSSASLGNPWNVNVWKKQRTQTQYPFYRGKKTD
jgi:hypothetical protein